jgi:steroid delta-isomerase-like uncharacterized protein
MVTTRDLERFFDDGWNKHDLDTLMTFMADDCVFESAGGPDPCGTRYVGKDRVRTGFQAVFARFPDVEFRGARHLVTGNRGLSEWTFTGTTPDGRRVEVEGCDLFSFRDGKIAHKSSYLKNRG